MISVEIKKESVEGKASPIAMATPNQVKTELSTQDKCVNPDTVVKTQLKVV